MRARLHRDQKKRQRVQAYELLRLQLLSLMHNQNLPVSLRFWTSRMYARLGRQASPTQIRNRCVLSGRGRGVYKQFRLSRILFREYADQGLLPGVHKSSW